jgi:EmrB/QacA subfamily drug resistance transporter
MLKNNNLKWLSLVVLSLALAIIVIDGTVLNVSQKYVIQDLNTDIKTIQWAFTGYSLVLAALTIFGGRLGDMFGRKKMFVLGAIIFAIGSFLTAIAKDSMMLLIGWSLIEGIGAALMVPASSALLVSNFEGKERGIAFGIYGATAGFASSFGPIVGGFFASTIGWRWAFGINVFIAVILCLGAFIIKDKKEHYPAKTYLDYVGVLLSSFGLSLIVYGIIESSNYGFFKTNKNWDLFGNSINTGGVSVSILSVLFGIILLVLFVIWEYKLEKNGKDPLVSLSIFKNRSFSFGVATLASLFGGFSGLITYGVVFFFLTVKGMSALDTGLALIPFSIATFVMAPLSSKIADKIGQKNLVILGLLINTVGSYLIYQALRFTAVTADFIIPFLVSGIGFGLIAAQLNNIILSSIKISQSGVASGINGTLREIARALGVAIIGTAFISTFNATAVANITNQSNRDIPEVVKIKIIDSINSGQNSSLGKDNYKSDEQILKEFKETNVQNISIKPKNIDDLEKITINKILPTDLEILANYKLTDQNIQTQMQKAITTSSKSTLLYTIGANIIAILMALGLKNKVKTPK